MRLLGSNLPLEAVQSRLADLANALNRHCPSGVGKSGAHPLKGGELDQVCRQGARWALKRGMASEEDLIRTEESGCLEGADPSRVSQRAKKRGLDQLGTLGAGNHFIEVLAVLSVPY